MFFFFDFFESVFPILFILVFLLILAVFGLVLVRGASAWHRNNQSPRLTVEALVVAKRMDMTHRDTVESGHSLSTWYYATFEVESGDRFELGMPGGEYGLLAEGDWGRLTFQGSRYIAFQRLSASARPAAAPAPEQEED